MSGRHVRLTLVVGFALTSVAAKRPDMVLAFSPRPGHACELDLTRAPGARMDYAVSRFVVPGTTPRSLGKRMIDAIIGEEPMGHAGLFPPIGVWNTFGRQDGHLLRAFVRDEWPFSREALHAIRSARAAWAPDRVDLAARALRFVEGHASGRGYWIDIRRPHPVRRVVEQIQTLHLLIPDDTRPWGVLVAADGALPSHEGLMNVRWTSDGYAHGAVLLPVLVREAGDSAPSYRVSPRTTAELEMSEEFAPSEEVE